MEAHGFRPRRRLGQNFLLDPSLHRFMADAVAVREGDLVLEVGAGLGFLTRELARRSARVLAVEVDARLHGILGAELPGFPLDGRGVHLRLGSAIAGSGWSPWLLEVLEAERAAAGGRFLVVSNLPYSISGPVLAGLAVLPEQPVKVAVMVQEDMAARVVAAPGSRAYGGLAAVVRASFDARLLRRVGREVFRPRPSVESAVLSLELRADGPLQGVGSAARADFAAFVRQLFAARRKKLSNALPRAAPGDSTCSALELPDGLADQRPGAVPPDRLVEIWRWARGLS